MRLRIAALSEGFIYGYSRLIFKGIDQAARDLDIDLVGITCGTMESPLPEMGIRNILYKHINPDFYDGFIIPYSALGAYAGYDTFRERLSAIFAKPCVTIGGQAPGHPCITPDWEQGMYELAEHLVQEHDCKRFLYVRGPKSHIMSNLREDGLRKALKTLGLPPDDFGILHADFSQEGGFDAGHTILADGSIERYDAILFVSDTVAGHAMHILQENGIRIPEDIIICACTNAPSGKQMPPLLTTLEEDAPGVGYEAVSLLKRRIEGRCPADIFKSKVKLLVRESCGCSITITEKPTENPLNLLSYFLLFRQLGFNLLSDSRLSEVFPLLHKELGMEFCSISLFEKGAYPFNESRSMASYADGQAIFHGENGPLFDTNRFVPDNLFSEKRRSILIEPLYYKEDWLGIFCIDFGAHNALLYEVILSQFASTIFLSLQHNKLMDAERRFYDMAVTSSDWLWETDPTGKLTYSSGVVAELTGLKTENLVGTDFFSILLPQTKGQLDALRKQMLISRESIRNQEVLSRTSGGSSIFFLLSGKPAFSESGLFIGYRGACRDITHSKQSEEQIRMMAYNDMLTGLPNRRLFMDRLEMEFRQARRDKSAFSIMFLDLDNFKHVNDQLGHEKGDELLKQVALCLNECIRGSDTLARVGGDEFVFLLPPVQNRESATVVAERVMRKFRTRFSNDSEFKIIGASIGIAQFPVDGEDIDTLIRNADEAMYRAKAAGKGGYCFYNPENGDLMQVAHKKKKSTPKILFVPIYSLQTGDLVGFRSCIGKKEKERSIKFALGTNSEAEEIGDLHEEAVSLAQMTATIARWNESYRTELFCVHQLNTRKISNTEIFGAFMEAISAIHLPPRLQHLAITNNISPAETEHATKALFLLAKLGFPLILSGCTAVNIPLALIEKVHFNSIAFHASETDKSSKSERYASLFSTVTNAAHCMGSTLYAEDISSDAQKEAFKKLGFTIFNPPQPKEAIEAETAERLLSQRKSTHVR